MKSSCQVVIGAIEESVCAHFNRGKNYSPFCQSPYKCIIKLHLSCEYHITFSFSLFPLYLIYLARVYFPNSIPQPEDFKT